MAVSSWNDGTFSLSNVTNGTGHNFEHGPGIGLFMSSVVDDNPKKPGQHLKIKSLADDDGTR